MGLTSSFSTFGIPVCTQPAFGDAPGIFPIGTATAFGVRADPSMASTKNSSSLFANTIEDPFAFLGSAALWAEVTVLG